MDTEHSPTDTPPQALSDDQVLIDWLKDRDSACPLCGYNLRGLISPRCPECGQVLRLSVTLAEPYLKAWIAMIAGLLPVAGIGSIFIVTFIYGMIVARSSFHFEFPPIGISYLLSHAVMSVPLSIAVIAFRRRILAWKKGTQQGVAALVWLAVLVSVITVVSYLR